MTNLRASRPVEGERLTTATALLTPAPQKVGTPLASIAFSGSPSGPERQLPADVASEQPHPSIAPRPGSKTLHPADIAFEIGDHRVEEAAQAMPG